MLEVTGEERRDAEAEAEPAAAAAAVAAEGVVARTDEVAPAPAVRGRPLGLAPVGSLT